LFNGLAIAALFPRVLWGA